MAANPRFPALAPLGACLRPRSRTVGRQLREVGWVRWALLGPPWGRWALPVG